MTVDDHSDQGRLPDNQVVWKQEEIVGSYVPKDFLFTPEKTILKRLKPALGGWKMLDLGVGAGRTTGYFAPLVKEYVGVDYSDAMVESCRQKFRQLRNATFEVGDARQLDVPSKSVDFVLFSFNGLDTMEQLDRERTLAEMQRVLRDDGVLCFSTHNTRNLREMYSFQFPLDPRRIRWEYQRYRRIQLVNGPASQFAGKDWFTIRDGAHDFKFWVFYILPELQVRGLAQLGFREITAYSLRQGAPLSKEALLRNTESWLYYLCKSSGAAV